MSSFCRVLAAHIEGMTDKPTKRPSIRLPVADSHRTPQYILAVPSPEAPVWLGLAAKWAAYANLSLNAWQVVESEEHRQPVLIERTDRNVVTEVQAVKKSHRSQMGPAKHIPGAKPADKA